MPTTTITTGTGDLVASKSGAYNEVFSVRQEVDNSNTFVTLISASATKGTATLNDCKSMIIKNSSDVAVEIQFQSKEWTDATPDSNAGTDSMQLFLLGAGEFMYLPNFRQLNFQADANSGGTAYQLTNQVPDSNMYVDSGADVDHATSATIGSDATHTTLNLEDGHSKYFKVGDLIRLENEICEVTAVGTGADLANSTLTIIRGLYGSTAATHADDVAVRFPFFNAYADFDKYSVSQTDDSGNFKCMNFFGYGRYTTGEADGLVPGSISGKFYRPGYQELGMSGITGQSSHGLASNTAYAIDVSCDGSSDHTLTFTTDATGKFGGSTGLIQKIQDALNTQFTTTSSNLLNKGVTCAIVNGDIRFTSQQHLSSSAIAISAPASGTTPFGVGAFNMAVGAIEAAVPAKLPDDTIINTKTGQSEPNIGAFFYDDGHGNIKGVCSGSINYLTGKLILRSAPKNAQFVVDANYGSAHSGGNNFGASTANSLLSVGARCCNSKLNAVVEVRGLK